MATQKTLAKNTLYLTFASVGQKAIAFVYFALIARFFGTEDTGAYFLALAVIVIIAVLDDLGITSVLIREIAKAPEKAKAWCRTMIGVKVITMPITIGVAWLVPMLLGYDAELTWLIRFAICIMLADTLSLSFYGILRGLHHIKYESLGIFVGQALTTIIGLSVMYFGEATLPVMIFALICGSSWNMLFSMSQVIWRLGWGALVPSYEMGWKPLKMAFAFFLAAAFVKIYSYVDSLTLQQVLGEDAVGIYAVAYKLTYAFQFIPLAFVASLYPVMSSHAKDVQQLKKTLLNAFWYMGLIGFPIVFGLWSIAPELIAIVYGDGFTDSVVALQTLVFVLIFIFLDFPIGSLLNATDRQSIKTAIMGMTMVINITANVLLIPIFGVLGACYAALISFVFLFCAGWFAARRVVQVSLRELFSVIGGMLFAAVIMALAVVIIKDTISIYAAVPVGVLIYGTLLWLFGAVNMQHLKQVRQLLR